MTDAAPPLTPPDDTAFPPCGEGEEWARAMLQRELEVLGELAELGLKMARTIVAQASGEGPEAAEPAIQGDLPLAFSRVSRAARMAVLLQARLIQDIKTGGRKGGPGNDEDEGPVRWDVEWVDEDPPWAAPGGGRDEAEAGESRETERMESERPERLERDDIYADLMTLPKEELVARIRRDLGVGVDQCATSPASGVRPIACDWIGRGPRSGGEGIQAQGGFDGAAETLETRHALSTIFDGPPPPPAGEVASP